tara:strand:- start:3 stop:386 length:384 start_codon:yes stop_codon:yes gene_type:complete
MRITANQLEAIGFEDVGENDDQLYSFYVDSLLQPEYESGIVFYYEPFLSQLSMDIDPDGYEVIKVMLSRCDSVEHLVAILSLFAKPSLFENLDFKVKELKRKKLEEQIVALKDKINLIEGELVELDK